MRRGQLTAAASPLIGTYSPAVTGISHPGGQLAVATGHPAGLAGTIDTAKVAIGSSSGTFRLLTVSLSGYTAVNNATCTYTVRSTTANLTAASVNTLASLSSLGLSVAAGDYLAFWSGATGAYVCRGAADFGATTGVASAPIVGSTGTLTVFSGLEFQLLGSIS